jgi:hypothetical protein
VSVLEFRQEIPRLTKAERLQAMEWLWASLREQEPVASPDWHRDVLAVRQAKLESGDAQFLTIAQLQERLRR